MTVPRFESVPPIARRSPVARQMPRLSSRARVAVTRSPCRQAMLPSPSKCQGAQFGGRLGAGGQSSLEPATGLGVVTAQLPEAPEALRHAQPEIDWIVLDRPGDGRAEVVMFALVAAEPLAAVRTEHVRVGVARKRVHPAGVGGSDSVFFPDRDSSSRANARTVSSMR